MTSEKKQSDGQDGEANQEPNERRGLRLPLKTGLFSLVVIVGLVVMRIFKDALHEMANLGGDELNLITVVTGMVLFLIWCGWWFLLSGARWQWKAASLVVLIGLGFTLYKTTKIIPGGDVGIARIEFYFLQNELDTDVAESNNAKVDLSTGTPFDFPGFRGARRDGVVSNVRLEDWKTAAPELIWKQEVGKGWSAFSAVNGFAVTMEQRQEFECVTCYEIASGDLKWIHKRQTRHEDIPGLGGAGPRSTPTIDGGRVYVQSATGVFACLNGADGSVLWEKNIPELMSTSLTTNQDAAGYDFSYESNDLTWGRAGSPLVYQDKVIVPGGGPLEGPFVTLLAFDKVTGEEKWRGGDEMIGYGSPSVGEILGRDHILLVGESVATGHDPETGKILWKHRRPGKSSADANNSQVTYVDSETILLSKGYRAGGERVQISEVEGEFKTKRVWKNPRVLKTKFNSPVIRDGYAYSISAGYLECTNVETGKQEWLFPNWKLGERKDRVNQGQFLLVDDKLIVMSEDGNLYLIAAEPEEYRQLGRVQAIDGVCWNNLCLYGEYLLVRSDLEAACYKLPLKDD